MAIVYNKYAQGTLLRKRDSDDDDWVTHNNKDVEVMNGDKVELLEDLGDALDRGSMCHVKYKKHKGYIRCKYLRSV
jgi:asparagine synthetase A